MNDYKNRVAIKHTPPCGEVCTSVCECDCMPFREGLIGTYNSVLE